MSERQAKKRITLVDPFTGINKKVPEVVVDDGTLIDVDWNKRPILGVDLDKETGNTNVVVTGVQDVHEEIQHFKDQCGFEGMRNLIARGQARPLDFADDGKHGFDSSKLPDNVNDAYRASMAAGKGSNNIFDQLGIKPIYDKDGKVDVAATEKLLTDAITGLFKQKANEAVNKEGEDK